MRKLITIAAAFVAGSGFSLAAQAAEPDQVPEVIERNEQGLATKVKIGEREYEVCTPDNQDSCVNAREIGLDQGNRPIGYWPGKPASEIEGDLPLEKPAEPDETNKQEEKQPGE